MILTIFDSLDTGKTAISPYNDETFNFNNIETTLDKVHTIFEKNYVLSRPLKNSIKTTRDTNGLLDNYANSEYIIIDLDDVMSKKDSNLIIEYFKNNKYSINIFKSSSYGKGKFNLKCLVLVDFETTRVNIEAFINKLTYDLRDLCKVDMAAARTASYQAPSKIENSCVYYNDGITVKMFEILEYITEFIISESIDFSKDVSKWFFDYFINNYSMEYKNRKNSNGTIQCALPGETKSKFGYYWDEKFPYLLQHPQRIKTINAYSDFIKSEYGKEYIKNKHLEEFKDKFKLNSDININDRYIQVNDDISNSLKVMSYSLNRIIAVKSAMGTGKSSIIEELLRVHKSKILLISMRRSLSYDIKEKYKEYNVKHYIDDLNDISETKYRVGDNLVIQVDSLYKIDVKNFDYVVIDEFESLCLYTQQNMVNSSYYVACMRNLRNIFKDKKLLILDAFINKLSINLYFNDYEVKIIENYYKDNTNVLIYDDKNTFIRMIEESVKSKCSDEVITCSFSTLNELYAIKDRLIKDNVKCVSITSDTPSEARKLIQELLSLPVQDKYDVFLFSPSITVGISILNNVKSHFHYDTGKTIDPISSVQMIKRSRTATNIHCYISGRSYLNKTYNTDILNETTRKNIKEYLNDSKNTLFYNIDTGDISELGKFINSFIAHKNFYINNHKEAFLFLLGIQFNSIKNISFKSSKIDLKNKKKNVLQFDKKLDLSDYHILYNKFDKTKEETYYLELLEIKKEFNNISDDGIKLIHSKKIFEKLKNINIFLNTNIEQKYSLLNNYIFTNMKDVLSHKTINIELIQKMIKYQECNFKLLEFYKSNEDIDKDFLRSMGYKYKNKLFKIDKNIRRFIECL